VERTERRKERGTGRRGCEFSVVFLGTGQGIEKGRRRGSAGGKEGLTCAMNRQISYQDDSYEAVERRRWAATILDSPEMLAMYAQSRQDVRPIPPPIFYPASMRTASQPCSVSDEMITLSCRPSPPRASTSPSSSAAMTIHPSGARRRRINRGARAAATRCGWRSEVVS